MTNETDFTQEEQPAAGPTAESFLPAITSNPPPAEPSFDFLDALTRLVVGALLEAPDELSRRLQIWEAEAAQQVAENVEAAESATAVSPPITESDTHLLRYALAGMLLEGPAHARRGASLVGKVALSIGGSANRRLRPFTHNRLTQPLHQRYDQLADHGETVVNRWIANGRSQSPASRALAREAVTHTIDDIIEHLAQNEEVRGLVQQQGVGLAADVVDGVRARTVTADDILEKIVRSFLKRPPREQLPPPPAEIQAQAEHLMRKEELSDGH
jgi:hypothetical protein